MSIFLENLENFLCPSSSLLFLMAGCRGSAGLLSARKTKGYSYPLFFGRLGQTLLDNQPSKSIGGAESIKYFLSRKGKIKKLMNRQLNLSSSFLFCFARKKIVFVAGVSRLPLPFIFFLFFFLLRRGVVPRLKTAGLFKWLAS
jgi:hypothetical protein